MAVAATMSTRYFGSCPGRSRVSGGKLVLDVNGVPIRGAFLVVEPSHRLVFSWGAAGNDVIGPGSTSVEIRLRPDGDGTLLELVHRDLPAEELPQHGIGWGHFLARLVVAATGADPGPDPWARP
jgi:uncharacterized protein YndB with AHSA1/START domain